MHAEEVEEDAMNTHLDVDLRSDLHTHQVLTPRTGNQARTEEDNNNFLGVHGAGADEPSSVSLTEREQMEVAHAVHDVHDEHYTPSRPALMCDSHQKKRMKKSVLLNLVRVRSRMELKYDDLAELHPIVAVAAVAVAKAENDAKEVEEQQPKKTGDGHTPRYTPTPHLHSCLSTDHHHRHSVADNSKRVS
jgi:hypothetical protein